MKKKLFLLFFFNLIVCTGISCSRDDYEKESLQNPKEGEDVYDHGSFDDDSLFNADYMKCSLFASNNITHQSAASYGDYAIFIPNYRSRFSLYNLKEKTIVCEKELGAISEKIGRFVLYHCNQSSFGVDFYLKDDPFPLLYISQRAREDKRSFVEVYRLKPSRPDSQSEYNSLDAELIQTIYFPVMTEENGLGRVNCVIDTQYGNLYTYSYSTVEGDVNYGKCRISRFSIPDIYETEVFLDDDSIIDTFTLDYNSINSQGGCINDGKLFIGQGYLSAGYIYLNVIDLKKKRLINQIDLIGKGITWEPEGCFIYNNNVMIGGGKNIWEFSFEKKSTNQK